MEYAVAFETSFVFVGLLGGFAYLAWRQKHELLAYGIGFLATGFLLQGFEPLMGSSWTVTLQLFRNIAFGGGFAFLAYVGAIEGYRYYGIWKEKRRKAAEAFQLQLAARKDPEAKRATTGRS